VVCSRFVRVPSVDANTADAIFDAVVAAGLWDRTGQRIASIDAVEDALPRLSLPSGLSPDQRLAIRDEIDVVLRCTSTRPPTPPGPRRSSTLIVDVGSCATGVGAPAARTF
jgi:hypothetical protein